MSGEICKGLQINLGWLIRKCIDEMVLRLCFVAALTVHMYTCHGHLLVLSPPRSDDNYYKDVWSTLLPFYVDYARKINKTSDSVALIIQKEDVEQFIAAGTPRDWIIEDVIDDPWIRDVSPVLPSKSIQFKYIGGGTVKEATATQSVFNEFASKYSIRMKRTGYYLDGGNVVDNNIDKAIVTDKFMADNDLTLAQATAVLKEALGVPTVIIVPADEPKLGHSDGMVSFPCANTIFVTSYTGVFRDKVMSELARGCKDCSIIEVPTFYDNSTYKGGYASSCGVYVNSVVTNGTVYVPQFKHEYDAGVVRLYETHSCGKTVVPVDATAVCKMGGSLRCLSWQLEDQSFKSGSMRFHLVHSMFFVIPFVVYYVF